jgi:hypothetical protein
MELVRRLTGYVADVVDTIQDVLAVDDPLLCDCDDDRWCTDCALLAPVAEPAGWPAPLDAA